MKEDHYFKCMFKETLEFIKHPNNLNKDVGVEVSNKWIPLLSHI